MNKASQQPKGTAFVEYWDIQAAAAAAAACQKARYTHLPLFQPNKTQPARLGSLAVLRSLLCSDAFMQ